eukprot:871824-Pyramimonas_sp.AAC.1
MGSAPRGLRQCTCGGIWNVEAGSPLQSQATGKRAGMRGARALGPTGCRILSGDGGNRRGRGELVPAEVFRHLNVPN